MPESYFSPVFSPMLDEDAEVALRTDPATDHLYLLSVGSDEPDDNGLVKEVGFEGRKGAFRIKLRELVVYGPHYGLPKKYYYLSEAISELRKHLNFLENLG